MASRGDDEGRRVDTSESYSRGRIDRIRRYEHRDDRDRWMVAKMDSEHEHKCSGSIERVWRQLEDHRC